ncbi:MAG: S8 family serine peptidase, partial [Candidatus Thermoplasmatota archaeon]|nr:S8 family serine peptidase [Candidatus Thermoplasmatota archaeon]
MIFEHVPQAAAILLVLTPLLSILGGAAAPPDPVTIPCWEPLAVRPFDWNGWDGDINCDRIDDRLQGDPFSLDGDGALIGVNIHFRYYPTPNDASRVMQVLGSMGKGTVFHHAGRSSTALYLSVPRSIVPEIYRLVDPSIEMIEYRPVYVSFLDVSSPATRSKWSSLYSPLTASDLGYSGDGIVVAVIDSGVDNNIHESMRGKYVYGVDFTGTTIVEGLDPDDIDGHGTHVAGTVMGSGGNQGIYQGTAPSAQLVDLRYA